MAGVFIVEVVRLKIHQLRRIAKYTAIVLFCVSQGAWSESESPEFDEWLSTLKQEAIDKGVSEDTVTIALSDVHFIERVIASDRSQAEFKETYHEYINKRVSEYRIKKGVAYLNEHGEAMNKVTLSYGVPARFVAAIIGVETNYGTFTLKHSLFDVLVTLSYDSRRGARFRKEIFAALEILDNGEADLTQLKTSWAGALGVPQFMPSTYATFAVDYDGDGSKDIWSHGPDLWASVARYLNHYGWKVDQAWARKVLVPPQQRDLLSSRKNNIADVPKGCVRYKKHLQGWDLLSGWNAEGVRRMNGTELPRVEMPASMIVTNPDLSHAYLVYENFCALMRYNPSFKYALSVGVLADNLKLNQ